MARYITAQFIQQQGCPFRNIRAKTGLILFQKGKILNFIATPPEELCTLQLKVPAK